MAAELGLNTKMTTVLTSMARDDVGEPVQSDALLNYLRFQVENGMWKFKKTIDQLRARLRYAGRLLKEMRKTVPAVTLFEGLWPCNIDWIVEATNSVAKAVKSNGTAEPGTAEPTETAVKIGHMVKALVMRMLNKSLRSGDQQLVQESWDLQEILRQEWIQRVVVPVKYAIKENKRNERILLPTILWINWLQGSSRFWRRQRRNSSKRSPLNCTNSSRR